MASVPINHFDRSRPFYPLVTNYIVALHGFVELASRRVMRLATGIIDQGEADVDLSALGVPGEPITQEQLTQLYSDPANRSATPLIERLALWSEAYGESTEIDPEAIAAEVFENAVYLLPWTVHAGGLLLVSAWETTKAYADGSPTWEFLRHCRNAAAHGGRFRFLDGEPRRTAQWKSLEVQAGLQGSPLFKGYDQQGLLSPGDPVRLLWDLEQISPDLEPDLSGYPEVQ